MKPCSNPAGVGRRLNQTAVKLAAAQVRLRRSKRLAAAETSGAQIPSSHHHRQAANRRPSRSPPLRTRIQSRGGKIKHSPAAAPYYWGAKGRRGGGGGCNNNPPAAAAPAPPQILQSRGEKRKYYSASPSDDEGTTLPAWGAKRARSSPDRLLQDHDVDWASLPDGPAGLIAELVLAGDVADYVRFRAVCRPWRRCSPDPRAGGLDGRFLPRRWIMLDKAHAGPRLRRFLNTSTGECIRMDLPELDEHVLLALTPEGLLLLLHDPTLVVRLLNPLTRQLTDLPPVTPLLPPEVKQFTSGARRIGDALGVYGVGVTHDSTVAVCFSLHTMLVVAKPGDDRWTLVYKEYLDFAGPFAGRFYGCVRGSVMVLNTSLPPRLQMAVERRNLFRFSPMSDSLHLVDNDGELMLVHRLLCHHAENNKYRMKYQVYRVDLDSRVLVPVNGFGGRVVFMGRSRTISVPAGALPSARADTLYLGFDCDEKTMLNKIDGYNLADGSSEPCNHDLSFEMVHPCSVVDCLSHCIQGVGDHLASSH